MYGHKKRQGNIGKILEKDLNKKILIIGVQVFFGYHTASKAIKKMDST